MSVIHDPELERLLAALHARSDAQAALLKRYDATRAEGALTEDEIRDFRRDKLVALDRDKAELCYQLCRATDARRIVEIGTSFGVSTLYLAAAVRDSVRAAGGDGVVIGTEYEPNKASAARHLVSRHTDQSSATICFLRMLRIVHHITSAAAGTKAAVAIEGSMASLPLSWAALAR